MRERVCGATSLRPLSTLETVATETPAARAMLAKVARLVFVCICDPSPHVHPWPAPIVAGHAWSRSTVSGPGRIPAWSSAWTSPHAYARASGSKPGDRAGRAGRPVLAEQVHRHDC